VMQPKDRRALLGRHRLMRDAHRASSRPTHHESSTTRAWTPSATLARLHAARKNAPATRAPHHQDRTTDRSKTRRTEDLLGSRRLRCGARGEGGVAVGSPSVQIGSVTRRRRARHAACRRRPDARPSGDVAQRRLDARCVSSRRRCARAAHRA
jgi:hypothetical protein